MDQILKEAQQRWLRPAEICEILKNYKNFRIAPEPPTMPASTTPIFCLTLPLVDYMFLVFEN
jgi:hypothetical protein